MPNLVTRALSRVGLMPKPPLPTAVRFLYPWRGRVPGQVVGGLSHGVAQLLVQRRIAVWHVEEQTSAPVLVPPTPAPEDELPRGRRRR